MTTFEQPPEPSADQEESLAGTWNGMESWHDSPRQPDPGRHPVDAVAYPTYQPVYPPYPVHAAPPPEPTGGGLFHASIVPAAFKLVVVAGIAVAVPLTSWGSLATTWTRIVLACGGAGHDSAGHVVAGVVTVGGIWFTWGMDPGAQAKGRHGAHTAALRVRHYVARVLRWATITGSALVAPVALGIIHITTGAH